MDVAHYYDCVAKELRACVEGTPLRLVSTLRTQIGTIIAFDAAGWAIGSMSDNGVLTPLPAQLLNKRHVTQIIKSASKNEKPVMLQAPPNLPAIAKTSIQLYKGNDDDPKFFGTTEVIAVRLVNATYVYFGPIISFEIKQLCLDARRCIQNGDNFTLSSEVYRDKAFQGRVFVKAAHLCRLLDTFEPIKDKEENRGA
jgi:hypothetical protein